MLLTEKIPGKKIPIVKSNTTFGKKLVKTVIGQQESLPDVDTPDQGKSKLNFQSIDSQNAWANIPGDPIDSTPRAMLIDVENLAKRFDPIYNLPTGNHSEIDLAKQSLSAREHSTKRHNRIEPSKFEIKRPSLTDTHPQEFIVS